MHGVKIKGQKKSSSLNGHNDDDVPVFEDPGEYESMSTEEREAKTQEQMAALMKLPFASKIKGLDGDR